jgi:hypothetical protein
MKQEREREKAEARAWMLGCVMESVPFRSVPFDDPVEHMQASCLAATFVVTLGLTRTPFTNGRDE